MKCQKCHNQAILHITEVLGEEQFVELHLCEQCANKYLYESQQKAGKEEQLPRGAGPVGEEGKVSSGQSREAPAQSGSDQSKDTSTTPQSNTNSPQK